MEGRQAGSAMFAKLCAGCHSIGRGDRVGPDLDGLTLRRSRAWITDFLIDPIKMRSRQDPIALALAAKFPGVRMPYLQIHESDAADLISYIDAKSKQQQPTIALETLYALTTQDGGHLTAGRSQGPAVCRGVRLYALPRRLPDDAAGMVQPAQWSWGRTRERLKVLFVPSIRSATRPKP